MLEARDHNNEAQTGAVGPTPSGGTSPPPTEANDREPTMAEIEREVVEAMQSMTPEDLADLRGDVALPQHRMAHLDGESTPPGTALVGTVVGFSDEEVFLEFGPKCQGVLPRLQFDKPEDVEIGRRVDVIVDRYDGDAGLLLVNRPGTALRATWTNLAVGLLVEGKVIGLNKGGLEVDLHGIRAFMPGSQVDVFPMRDISVLLGETVRCEVIELDRRHKNVLVSRRKPLEQERAAAREKVKAELVVGQTRKGTVGTITDFGAFVDLGGIDGLIHKRDLSWGTVEKVSDVLKPGQEVEVQVLRIAAKRDRISLGLKQTQPDPWIDLEEKYPVESSATARILRLAGFGAFAELEWGVEGLIPIGEICWQRIKQPADVVSAGDKVDVKIIRVEVDKRRITLSMKQAQPDPWAEVLDSYPKNSLVKGTVTRLAPFGAFVELVPGVEGLLHISELSDQHVKTCRDVVEVGQEVEVRVLGVDRENRRIALSVKAVAAQAAAPGEGKAEVAESAKPAKQRKKPRRGGLSSHFEW